MSYRWGLEEDSFDPITQVKNMTAEIRYLDDNEQGTIIETAPQRCFTTNEFRALLDASGRFKIAKTYGAMDQEVPFSNERKAWGMVQVLVNA